MSFVVQFNGNIFISLFFLSMADRTTLSMIKSAHNNNNETKKAKPNDEGSEFAATVPGVIIRCWKKKN